MKEPRNVVDVPRYEWDHWLRQHMVLVEARGLLTGLDTSEVQDAIMAIRIIEKNQADATLRTEEFKNLVFATNPELYRRMTEAEEQAEQEDYIPQSIEEFADIEQTFKDLADELD